MALGGIPARRLSGVVSAVPVCRATPPGIARDACRCRGGRRRRALGMPGQRSDPAGIQGRGSELRQSIRTNTGKRQRALDQTDRSGIEPFSSAPQARARARARGGRRAWFSAGDRVLRRRDLRDRRSGRALAPGASAGAPLRRLVDRVDAQPRAAGGGRLAANDGARKSAGRRGCGGPDGPLTKPEGQPAPRTSRPPR